jgi:endonuclease I/V8-like Glu-specific endopeptidase
MQALFGTAGRLESFSLPAAGATPQERHATLRGALEKRSAAERLRANPFDAVRRRLKRIGVPEAAAEQVSREPLRSFAILEGRGTAPAVGLERIIGRNELLAIRYLDGGQRAARAVCRVVIRSASGRVLGYGTGFLVSPRLIMTNNHVLSSAGAAADSRIEFNFQEGLDGTLQPVTTFSLDPQAFFLTSPEEELDFTLVAVGPPVGAGGIDGFGFVPLTATTDEILDSEGVTIIQHPGGDPKQVALRENRVLKLPHTGEQFLYYETDTTPGSSGAPVFNDQWEVVALHHSGFPARDEQGRYLTPDGQLWSPEMGEQRLHWIANEGVRVAALADFLGRESGLSDAQKRLRDEALHPPRVTEAGAVQPVLTAPQPRSGPDTAVPVPQAGSAAQFTFMIPLHVTISVGAPASAGAPATSTPASVSGPSPAATSPGVAPAAVLGLQQGDVAEATAELGRAAARAYYDAEADRRDRDAYYRGLQTNLSPAQLYDALGELVRSTHRNRPKYNPIRQVYPWVDLQPNLKIKSVYSGQQFEPLELIRADFEVEQARQERLSRFRASEAAGDPGREAAMMDLLEAQLPYNCEHVVPQSWFGKREPMRGDLHHLFACESGCNSFRGNTPYFNFAPTEAVRQGCGRREAIRFEPTAGKGAVARATLYFLLCYPGEINRTATEYTPDRIAMLLGWHRDEPPGDYERHRNQAIFAVQGNRNPLIDRPELAGQVDFLRGLG